jgi:predicted nucleotidyltransferase
VTEPVLSQRALLAALVNAGVEFVVIGGHAVSAHGYERATRDVDIVFSTDPASCERFVEVLDALGASIQIADIPPPGGRPTAEWLAEGGHFVFDTEHGPLDALSWIAGFDFNSLSPRAETAELADGRRIRVCAYEDLVRMKEVGGRPRDREDLRELARVRAEEEGR